MARRIKRILRAYPGNEYVPDFYHLKMETPTHFPTHVQSHGSTQTGPQSAPFDSNVIMGHLEATSVSRGPGDTSPSVELGSADTLRDLALLSNIVSAGARDPPHKSGCPLHTSFSIVPRLENDFTGENLPLGTIQKSMTPNTGAHKMIHVGSHRFLNGSQWQIFPSKIIL